MRPGTAWAGAGAAALAALVVGLLIATGRTLALDHAVHGWAAGLAHRRWLVAGAAALTTIGKVGVRGPLAAVAALLLARAGRGRAAAVLVAAVVGGELLVQGIKGLVGRARPPALDQLVRAAGSSFPSGHAAGCAILFPLLGALLLRQRPVVGAVAGALLAMAVGFTRVLLGVHWASDVAAGWLIGGAVALAAAGALRRGAGPAC